MSLKQLSIAEKQEVLLAVLKDNIGKGIATFGVGKDVAGPLIKKGLIHKDTYKFTGGCILTAKGVLFVQK
jgi:predicted transcriptional regulator